MSLPPRRILESFPTTRWSGRPPSSRLCKWYQAAHHPTQTGGLPPTFIPVRCALFAVAVGGAAALVAFRDLPNRVLCLEACPPRCSSAHCARGAYTHMYLCMARTTQQPHSHAKRTHTCRRGAASFFSDNDMSTGESSTAICKKGSMPVIVQDAKYT